VRPKSVELVSLLKTGNMDYAWEYLSVAVQHELKYVKLDDHINLGNYAFDDFYKQAQVKVTGKKPGTWITRTGQVLHLRHHAGQKCPQSRRGRSFLEYMLDPPKAG
jgi:molybdate/tungstate transport system substrate-binding protein